MKVTIKGDAVVITSSLKVSQIEEIKKVRPKALVLKGGENGKEDIFAIGLAKSGSGSLNNSGASFSSVSRGEGFATITIVADGITDVEKWIIDTYGSALTYLKELEEQLPAVIESVAADRAALMESITVVD